MGEILTEYRVRVSDIPQQAVADASDKRRVPFFQVGVGPLEAFDETDWVAGRQLFYFYLPRFARLFKKEGAVAFKTIRSHDRVFPNPDYNAKSRFPEADRFFEFVWRSAPRDRKRFQSIALDRKRPPAIRRLALQGIAEIRAPDTQEVLRKVASKLDDPYLKGRADDLSRRFELGMPADVQFPIVASAQAGTPYAAGGLAGAPREVLDAAVPFHTRVKALRQLAAFWPEAFWSRLLPTLLAIDPLTAQDGAIAILQEEALELILSFGMEVPPETVRMLMELWPAFIEVRFERSSKGDKAHIEHIPHRPVAFFARYFHVLSRCRSYPRRKEFETFLSDVSIGHDRLADVYRVTEGVLSRMEAYRLYASNLYLKRSMSYRRFALVACKRFRQ